MKIARDYGHHKIFWELSDVDTRPPPESVLRQLYQVRPRPAQGMQWCRSFRVLKCSNEGVMYSPPNHATVLFDLFVRTSPSIDGINAAAIVYYFPSVTSVDQPTPLRRFRQCRLIIFSGYLVIISCEDVARNPTQQYYCTASPPVCVPSIPILPRPPPAFPRRENKGLTPVR